MILFTDFAIEKWLCPDCMRKSHIKAGKSASDVDVSDSGRALNRQFPHHRAAGSEKAPAAMNAKPERKKRLKLFLRSASPRNPEVAQDKKEQRLCSSEQPKSSKKQDKTWTAREKNLVRLLMEEVISEQLVNLTEKKWEVISNRLASRFGFTRSKTSIKNYWSRQGRAQTRVDERRNPNPNKLITSVQNPDQRKRARQQMAIRPARKSYGDKSTCRLRRSRVKRRMAEEAGSDHDRGLLPTKRRKTR